MIPEYRGVEDTDYAGYRLLNNVWTFAAHYLFVIATSAALSPAYVVKFTEAAFITQVGMSYQSQTGDARKVVWSLSTEEDYRGRSAAVDTAKRRAPGRMCVPYQGTTLVHSHTSLLVLHLQYYQKNTGTDWISDETFRTSVILSFGAEKSEENPRKFQAHQCSRPLHLAFVM
ncbi:hypothetical protein N7539_006235 [Penicillium diatomitis]|uniref:Uncharacterized protein n=1 Tax=Penicillium diatomitis TaxID=2819901 RepID=A0A9W9X2R4_9EURO|nr:uncharacterized protein N7539_006235 [Penicillium diatomitis]KAJ5482789.1 hypothetical protein N7539_006235 [Penicillium diatomitis]